MAEPLLQPPIMMLLCYILLFLLNIELLTSASSPPPPPPSLLNLQIPTSPSSFSSKSPYSPFKCMTPIKTGSISTEGLGVSETTNSLHINKPHTPKVDTLERIKEIFNDRPQEYNQILIITYYFDNYKNPQIRKYFDDRYSMLESAKSYIKGISLFYAAEVGHHYGLMTHLYLLRTPINVTDEYGKTPLLLAVENGSTEAVLLLTEKDGDDDAGFRDCGVDRGDFSGKAPIHCAAEKGNVQYLSMLIESAGASISLVDGEEGMGALHIGAQNGMHEFCSFLIKAGNRDGVQFDKDATDLRGWTALHYAAFRGCQETVTVLVSFGCSKDVVDLDGNSPLDIAVMYGNEPIYSLLSCAN